MLIRSKKSRKNSPAESTKEINFAVSHKPLNKMKIKSNQVPLSVGIQCASNSDSPKNLILEKNYKHHRTKSDGFSNHSINEYNNLFQKLRSRLASPVKIARSTNNSPEYVARSRKSQNSPLLSSNHK